MHLATKEPEDVSDAEVDAGGVEALWCIPAGSDPDRALLDNHWGGSVVTSMHSERKAAAHIAKAAGIRSLVLNFRRSPEHKFPAQLEDVDNAYAWLLDQGYRAENIAGVRNSIGGISRSALPCGYAIKARRCPGQSLPSLLCSTPR